jgi:DNA-binding transcriptional ArsR family regulator
MDTFQALAEPRRREIIELLATHGKLSSTDISDNFKISKPAISQHLKILREAKLVDMEKSAQKHLYSINASSLNEIETWVHKMKRMWEEKFSRLDIVLEELKKKKRR